MTPDVKQGIFFEDLEIGQSVAIEHVVSEQDVIDFARVSGDHNPLHMDEEYAAKTVFGGRIAHGALTASYISSILGNDLPGPGSVFMGLELAFRRPVRIGDTVVAVAEVTEKIEKGNRVILAVRCEVDGKVVVRGQAKVMAPSAEKK